MFQLPWFRSRSKNRNLISSKKFADLLSTHKQLIIASFIDRVIEVVPGAQDHSRKYIEDHIGSILSEIAEFIASNGDESDRNQTGWLGNLHGRQRAEGKTYTLNDLRREYRILKNIILDQVGPDRYLSPRTSQLLHEIFEVSLSHATEKFVRNSASELILHETQRTEAVSNLLVAKDQRDSAEDETRWLFEVIDRIPKPLFLFDFAAKKTWFSNRAAREMLAYNYEDEDPMHPTIRSLIAFDMDGKLIPVENYPSQRTIRGETIRGEEIFIHVNDKRFHVKIFTEQIPASHGRPASAILLLQDITELKRTEADLLNAQAALASAIEIADVGFWEVDLPTATMTTSGIFLRQFGIDAKTFRGTQAEVVARIHIEDRPKVAAASEIARKNGSPYHIEYRVEHDDGDIRWIEARGSTSYDRDHHQLKFTGTTVDITDRKNAEDEIKRSAKTVNDILENTNDGFFSVDKNWIITRVNTNHETFTQIKRENQIGHNFLELFFSAPEYQNGQYWKSYHKAMNERIPVVFEDYYPPIDLWTSVSVYPQPDGGLAVFFRKTNEEKAIRKSLVDAKEEAERANQLKSAFLANMSHEIRTPLGAMLGFADLLRDPGVSATERASYIDILIRNGESLAIIINDILDLSKVESGHLNVEYTDAYPDKIAADVISLLRVKAKEKDLVLEYSHDDSCPQVVTSDPTRVRQILINLVGNAIKFTQYGTVKITAYGCHTEDGRPAVCFEVKDSGIGISPAQQEHIFEMFVQADGTMTRRFGGTGLGLALSRRLARALGGDVSIVESREGFGTTFLAKIEDRPDQYQKLTVREQVEHETTPEIQEGALKGIRVLVVDDAPDNQQLIWRYLTKQGAQVESAENGLVGYRAALQDNFDIVLMDVQMPIMDGYTATAKLRESGYQKPVIALTAHAMSEVRKKALMVGYTDHLPKPINAKQLVNAIVRHVTAFRGPTGSM